MPSLNLVHLIGNTTRQVDVKYTPKGTCIAELSLAINRAWKDDSGTKHEECTFVNCVFFAKRAEILANLPKGSALFVSGRLACDSWDDKDTGKKRSKMYVVGEEFQFLTPKPKGEAQEEYEPE